MKFPCFNGWEQDTICEIEDMLEEISEGAPQTLDAQQALPDPLPVQFIAAKTLPPNSKEFVDWDSIRPEMEELFETHGAVAWDVGGHDEDGSTWFRAWETIPDVDPHTPSEHRLVAILLVPGSSWEGKDYSFRTYEWYRVQPECRTTGTPENCD